MLKALRKSAFCKTRTQKLNKYQSLNQICSRMLYIVDVLWFDTSIYTKNHHQVSNFTPNSTDVCVRLAPLLPNSYIMYTLKLHNSVRY